MKNNKKQTWLTIVWLGSLGLMSGCAANGIALSRNPSLKQNFAQDQIGDVTLVSKQMGTKKTLLGKKGLTQEFLEGNIHGLITNWDGKPVEGVIVRVKWTDLATADSDPLSEELLMEQSMGNESYEGVAPAVADASAQESITDAKGIYRVRFSVPVIKGKVGLIGKMTFSPGWEEQLKDLGRAYEAYQKENTVKLFFSKNAETLAFSMGENKSVVQIHEQKIESQNLTQLTPATKRKPETNKKLAARRAEQILGLQILLLQHKMEKVIKVTSVNNMLAFTLNPDDIFDSASSQIKPNIEKGLGALADWMNTNTKKVTLSSPFTTNISTQSEVTMLTSLLKQKGVGLSEDKSVQTNGTFKISMNF